MARPTPKTFWLLLAVTLPAAFAVVQPFVGWLALGSDALLALLYAVDLALGRAADAASLSREMPDRAMRQRPFEVALRVDNPSARELRVRVWDLLPADLTPREAEAVLTVPAFGSAVMRRSVVAGRRGEVKLLPPAGERLSPFGLACWPLRVTPAGPLTVLPDLLPVRGFDALVRQRRLSEMGIRNARERGEGTDVVGLRPYLAGDPYSGIDWKATARSGRTISRERQAERRQNVVLLLDTGRRMAREADGQSRLDTAIEAAVLLGHAALRADDRIGMMAFADKPICTLAPMRTHTQAASLAHALYPLQAVYREPPYQTIAASIMSAFPRRSLLVLFTDVAEPRSADALLAPAKLLSRRHLLLCVFFEDAAVAGALRHPPVETADLYRAGAAAELAMEREQALRRLRQAGALVLESPGAQLSTTVVNEYLRIKARRLL
jgi:uncharacterized protein (DUF58 family)